jgi:putative membrane protein
MMTIAAVGALAVGLTACKQDNTSVSANNSMNVTDEPGVANMDAGANMGATANMGGNTAMADATSDPGFANAVAASDMFEIQSSKMALETSKTPAVKSFAQMMVDEHTKSSSELKTLASGMKPALPLTPALMPDQQSMLDGLKGRTGADFDRAYLAAQRTGHSKTLATMNAYVAAAKPGALKDFASKGTGMVQKHLNMLDKIKV